MPFKVVPASVPVRTEEWESALKAPDSELPPLSEADRDFVRRWQINPESHRRRKLLVRKYVFERQQRQGTLFGELVDGVVKPLGRGYSVVSVIRSGEGWNLTLHNAAGEIFAFYCLLEVVEALADGTATKEERRMFRDNLLSELQRQDSLEAAS